MIVDSVAGTGNKSLLHGDPVAYLQSNVSSSQVEPPISSRITSTSFFGIGDSRSSKASMTMLLTTYKVGCQQRNKSLEIQNDILRHDL